MDTQTDKLTLVVPEQLKHSLCTLNSFLKITKFCKNLTKSFKS